MSGVATFSVAFGLIVLVTSNVWGTSEHCDDFSEHVSSYEWNMISITDHGIKALQRTTDKILLLMSTSQSDMTAGLRFLNGELSWRKDSLKLFAINLVIGQVGYILRDDQNRLSIQKYRCTHVKSIAQFIDSYIRNEATFHRLALAAQSGKVEDISPSDLEVITRDSFANTEFVWPVLKYFGDLLKASDHEHLKRTFSIADYRRALSLIIGTAYVDSTLRADPTQEPDVSIWLDLYENPRVNDRHWDDYRNSDLFDKEIWSEFMQAPQYNQRKWNQIETVVTSAIKPYDLEAMKELVDDIVTQYSGYLKGARASFEKLPDDSAVWNHNSYWDQFIKSDTELNRAAAVFLSAFVDEKFMSQFFVKHGENVWRVRGPYTSLYWFKDEAVGGLSPPERMLSYLKGKEQMMSVLSKHVSAGDVQISTQSWINLSDSYLDYRGAIDQILQHR